ncbi:MAG: TonB-dependent receptor [Saprospiraceae bacterium]|nr:TonB-dependent receptor [Saprospiraceae bacterium]
MKQRHYLLSLVFAALSFTGLMAQTSLSGKITDAESGEPIYGATVVVKGSNVGTVTDFDGNYTLNVPAGATTLVVSYIGFKSEELAISGDKLDVALSEGIEIEAVTVIGSRNATRTKLESAVPVDIIPIASVMSEVGQVDLNQILTYIAPSFQSARQTIADGTDHVDPAQLRGLGSDQVLVLINGKRRHQSALVNVNGTVNRGTVGTDLSAISATAIERIEILRDGAAAQYGSDAFAGVVNIVLKQKTGVVDGSVSYGLYATSYDKNYASYKLSGNSADPSVNVTDGNTLQAGLNYGFKLGRKGFISLTGEYISRDATNRAGAYTGQVYPNVNGADRSDSLITARGLTRETFDMLIGASEMKGGGAMLNGEYGLSKNWSVYAFGGYNQKNGVSAGFYRYPNSVANGARVFANGVLGIYPNGFLPLIESSLSDISFAGGLRGKLGKQWNLDLSHTYGQNTFDFTITNSVNYTQFANNPGNTQTEFDAGGLEFTQNTTNLDLSRKFDVLEGLNLAFGGEYRSENFGIRAGEEASWRNYDTGSGAASGAQVFAGFFPANSGDNSRNSAAGYLDLEQDFTKNWLVTAAVRYENYSDFGSTFNYKAATRYKIGGGLSLRGSVSTGFRAPSMQQRFYAKTNTLFITGPNGLVPQEVGTFTNDSEPAKILGIPQLQEETSQSYAVGLTARPTGGLEITVDAYQIEIDNRIVLTNNFGSGGNADLQAQLTAAGAGQANFFSNAVNTTSRGLEAVIVYSKAFGVHDFRATLAGAFIDNEVEKGADGKPIINASQILIETGQVGNYFNREDQSRIEVANPKHKISFTLNYKVGKFSAMARAVNFGEVVYLDATINPALPENFPTNAFTGQKQTLDQTFSAKTVFDLSLTYRFLDGIGLTIGANNLLDTYQDLHAHSTNMSLGRFVYSRRVQQMGFNGRYVFARLKFDIK